LTLVVFDKLVGGVKVALGPLWELGQGDSSRGQQKRVLDVNGADDHLLFMDIQGDKAGGQIRHRSLQWSTSAS
jgi:hypothetical protein